MTDTLLPTGVQPFPDVTWPDDDLPAVWQPPAEAPLCDYGWAVRWMAALAQRSPQAPDVVLALQHPVVATVGRRGGRDSLLAAVWRDADGAEHPLAIHDVARGGKVTMHAPGQLVVYPIAHLASLVPPVGRGPLGDLPAFARLLEEALLATCGHFGLRAQRREGYAGVWMSERDKLASLGVGVTGGWSQHGVALNVCPDLSLFEAMVPCGIAGVRLTSMAEQLARQGRPAPSVAEVAAVLLAALRPLLRRGRAAQGLADDPPSP